MHAIELAFWLILLAIVLFIAYRIYRLMSKATGTPWQKFMSVFKYSGTILWARIVTGFGIIVGLLNQLSDYLTSVPQIQSAVHDVLNPTLAPWYLVFIGFLTEYLRRRPVPSNTPPVSAPLPPLASPPSAPTSPTVVTPAVVAPAAITPVPILK